MIPVDEFVDRDGACWQLGAKGYWTPSFGVTAAEASRALSRAFGKGHAQRVGCAYCGAVPYGNARTCAGCGAPRLMRSNGG